MSRKTSLKSRIAAGFAAVSAAKSGAGTAGTLSVATKGRGRTRDLAGDSGWHPLGGGRGFGQFYQGSDVDWEKKAGILWENGALAVCLAYVMRKLTEAIPEIVTEATDGAEEKAHQHGHPLLDILKNPNGEYSGKALFQAAAVSYLCAGEAFILKGRTLSGAGLTRELWFAPHWEMAPLAPPGNVGPTRFYKRTQPGPNGSPTVTLYSRDDVIHIKFGMDPRNPRRGWSHLRAMFCEIVSDRDIATFTATILGNLGVVGYMVSPESADDEWGEGQAPALKDKIRDSITGDNRGEVVVSDIPLRVTRVGYSPQELAITTMGDRPEARIVAAIGLNTMAVNLPAGKDSQKFANLKEARAAGWEDCIIPMLGTFAETINEELLPEFGMAEGEVFRWCLDKVRDLLPDLSAEHDRARKNWVAGFWKLSETRKATGQKVEEAEPDGFLWQLAPKKTTPTTEPTTDDPPPGDENDPSKETDS